MKVDFSAVDSLSGVKSTLLVSVVDENFVKSYTGCYRQVLDDNDFKGKNNEIAIANCDFGRIIFFGIGEPKSVSEFEERGSNLYKNVKKLRKIENLLIAFNTWIEQKLVYPKQDNGFLDILNGFTLSAYSFTRYFSEDRAKERRVKIESIKVLSKNKNLERLFAEKAIIAENVFFCRDLVNEPPNVLYPETFANVARGLVADDLKVEVFDEKTLAKMGAGGILAVGQGAEHRPCMVVLKYSGGEGDPIALVGKGITFDSGGINVKPPQAMETMKCDMSGAATVLSTIKLLAERKAKVNAVGVIPLAENMPSGTAMRLSDVVHTMSGQTIDIQHTDAEGRVILADALYYVASKFKPSAIIDLATLTGAICVALGEKYAGLFTNNGDLHAELTEAGDATGERTWRMPLDKIGGYYDKMIDSEIADVSNSEKSRDAGSITAAQFLQRFTDKHKKWAHIDIAATAFVKKDNYFVSRGATGWGVRLLNELIRAKYEEK